MRKITILLMAILLLIMPLKAYASDAGVEIKVDGVVKKGNEISILVNVKSVDKLYAASVDFIYDKSQLTIESISGSELVTSNKSDIMELGGETDKNGNTATYSFTFLGDKQGISGSGTLVVIKGKVIGDKELSISEDNMKIKLVKRSGESVENYEYSFVGYNIDQKDNEGTTPDNTKPNDTTPDDTTPDDKEDGEVTGNNNQGGDTENNSNTNGSDAPDSENTTNGNNASGDNENTTNPKLENNKPNSNGEVASNNTSTDKEGNDSDSNDAKDNQNKDSANTNSEVEESQNKEESKKDSSNNYVLITTIAITFIVGGFIIKKAR